MNDPATYADAKIRRLELDILTRDARIRELEAELLEARIAMEKIEHPAVVVSV